MSPRRNNLRSNRSAGHLLILGCSDRKRAAKGKLPALDLYDGVFPGMAVYAEGGMGLKRPGMKSWLFGVPSSTATLPGQQAGRAYLYFFPDWDDYVKEPFVHETDDAGGPASEERLYAHEIFG